MAVPVAADDRRSFLALRLVLSLLLGATGGLLAYVMHTAHAMDCDFAPLWIGARAVLHRASPYAAVRASESYPLFYPGPALLIALPFAPLSRDLACAAFAGVASGLMAFALSAQPWRLTVFMSVSAIHGIGLAQWSPLALAAWSLPPLGVLWVAKPQVGLPVLLARPDLARRLLALGIGLVAASLAVVPTWPQEWLQSLGGGVHISPLLRPGGVLLLAAALRWRRPEARWLLTIAVLPQTSVLYETLPLFVVPRTWREMATLTVLSWLALVVQSYVPGQHTVAATTAARWPVLLVLLWLPALAMVLRRPNAAPATGFVQTVRAA